MKAPKTFTGENTVEISCHNNPFLIDKIIALAIKHGAQQAEPGEFTKRALLNNKIDLLQAEAINDLISAQTEIAVRKSLAQVKGSLSHEIKIIEKDLVELLALVETSFEFLEEEQTDINLEKTVKEKLRQLIEKTKKLTAHYNSQKQVREGVRIAIIGSVNAGKSTLLNTLVNDDRAIVTSEPGTTRDAVQTTLYENGHFWLLIDTAGIRETKNEIEKQGIERSWTEGQKADIIVLLLDATKDRSSEEKKWEKALFEKEKEKIIVAVNKTDKVSKTYQNYPNALPISAKEKIGIEKLKKAIHKKTNKLIEKANSPFLLNRRQHNLILELNRKLEELDKKYTNRIQYELMAHHLTEIVETVAQVTGKAINERVLDSVFSNFCVGK